MKVRSRKRAAPMKVDREVAKRRSGLEGSRSYLSWLIPVSRSKSSRVGHMTLKPGQKAIHQSSVSDRKLRNSIFTWT